jgi:hypothetical protein
VSFGDVRRVYGLPSFHQTLVPVANIAPKIIEGTSWFLCAKQVFGTDVAFACFAEEHHEEDHRVCDLCSSAGAVGELVGIDGGVVSGVINLESSGVEASDWRPRHDERYHEA